MQSIIALQQRALFMEDLGTQITAPLKRVQ